MDKNTATTIILLVLVAIFAGASYYLYSKANECQIIALELKGRLEECGAGLSQVKAGLDACLVQAQNCQDVLTGLQQIPACAAYFSTE